MVADIHPTAIVEEGAVIGENSRIGPYCFVSSKAKIGSDVELYQGARVCGDTAIGDESRIFSYAVIGSIPQDLKFKGEDVKLIIGKKNTIREFALINPGTEHGGGKTVIGDNNLFMGYTHVAHDCLIGSNNIFANAANLAGHVEVGDFVVVGGMTPIHQFVKIGDRVMIGGASAVAQDIPPFCLAEGNRAIVKSLNLVGLRRSMEKDDIKALKSAFKKIFRGNLPLKEGAEEITKESKNEKVVSLCEFILNTKRGIPFERRGDL